MPRRIRITTSIGYPGADHVDEIEVDDDLTERDLDQIAQDAANNYIETWWEDID